MLSINVKKYIYGTTSRIFHAKINFVGGKLYFEFFHTFEQYTGNNCDEYTGNRSAYDKDGKIIHKLGRYSHKASHDYLSDVMEYSADNAYGYAREPIAFFQEYHSEKAQKCSCKAIHDTYKRTEKKTYDENSYEIHQCGFLPTDLIQYEQYSDVGNS